MELLSQVGQTTQVCFPKEGAEYPVEWLKKIALSDHYCFQNKDPTKQRLLLKHSWSLNYGKIKFTFLIILLYHKRRSSDI